MSISGTTIHPLILYICLLHPTFNRKQVFSKLVDNIVVVTFCLGCFLLLLLAVLCSTSVAKRSGLRGCVGFVVGKVCRIALVAVGV